MVACCKVGAVIDRYPLERSVVGGDIDEYLAARWRGDDGYPETGIRPLAEWFNKRLLQEVYSEHGRTATEVRVGSEYEALTSDDEVERGEILDDLQTDDIDGLRLTEDFVSPSTLYRHFRNCLDVEKPTSSGDADPTWEADKVAYARETARENVREALRSLDNKERLPNATTADLDVAVTLSCPECATRVPFETALERGFVCRDHLGVRDDPTSRPDGVDDTGETGPQVNPNGG
jgi:hypothetical protein